MTVADLPLVLTIEEAAKALRIGRSAAYAAAAAGDLPTVKIGRCLRVPRHRLEAMLGIEPENGKSAGGEPDAPSKIDDTRRGGGDGVPG